ncbi:MAG TPA: hypothetical protein VIW95_01340 [Candidatus Binatus sp.]|uniref:hypothetical protein n=1 Tax=Candidatus Binatus sp. TaxID=2811406 RepID=UPI002F3ED2AC
MSLAKVLGDFKADVAQCGTLILHVQQKDARGKSILPLIDQKQVVVASFLNMSIAWENFLGNSLSEFMVGSKTLRGKKPVRYVAPTSRAKAREMILAGRRYFDYLDVNLVRTVCQMYFRTGYPYYSPISGSFLQLSDLKTMRNFAAHVTSTTRASLSSVTQRVFSAPQPGMDLYKFLIASDPASTGTIFLSYQSRLIVTAELIANG